METTPAIESIDVSPQARGAVPFKYVDRRLRNQGHGHRDPLAVPALGLLRDGGSGGEIEGHAHQGHGCPEPDEDFQYETAHDFGNRLGSLVFTGGPSFPFVDILFFEPELATTSMYPGWDRRNRLRGPI